MFIEKNIQRFKGWEHPNFSNGNGDISDNVYFKIPRGMRPPVFP